MSIRLYMDVHVPYAISFGLRLREVDVLTSQEDGTIELEDSDLLDRATVLARALFTQDTDFLRIARERQQTGIDFAGIISSGSVMSSDVAPPVIDSSLVRAYAVVNPDVIFTGNQSVFVDGIEVGPASRLVVAFREEYFDGGKCSLCGVLPNEAASMFQGHSAWICDGCVVELNGLLNESAK